MTDLTDLRDIQTDLYEPAEDTYLLANTAVDRYNSSDRVLDVGCGSGFIAEAIAETGAEVVGSDLNPYACHATRDRGIPVIRGNLLDPFSESVFDGVVFNPPYLPIEQDETRKDWMGRALAGGSDGRAIIDPFLDDVGRVLTAEGEVLLLVSSVTGIEAVIQHAAINGFSAVALTDEQYPFETLTVLLLTR